jgi:hypothetical protein
MTALTVSSGACFCACYGAGRILLRARLLGCGDDARAPALRAVEFVAP